MNDKNQNRKWKLANLVIALTMLLQPFWSTIVEATANQGTQAQVQVQTTNPSTTPAEAVLDEFLSNLDEEEDDDANNMAEPVHPPIEDLYEQLQEHDRVYDEDGGFYELVPISDLISDDDLERVIDELNDDDYSIISDWVLFNIDGEELPTPRTHVVRHQRFLGTTGNSRYFFRHIPGFNQDGNLPPSNSGNGWRLQTWQINIGGSWIRAFCTQPGIVSAEPGRDELPGWGISPTANLTQIQRDTIGRILQHGYRNIYRPPSSNSENWSFPSGSGADDLLDDVILVTQIMIQEVAAGHWNMNNITLGDRSPINGSGVYGDTWRRLIANSSTSTGMVGGPTWQVTQGHGGASFDPRPAVGNVSRMDMFDAIRHDVYFFGRRDRRPRGTSASSTTSNRPVHTLTWSNTHQMYRVEIDDRISSGGTGTLRRFFGNRTSGSLGIGGGYRFCRGTQTAGVCNPSTTSNRLFIYTRDSNAVPTNSSDGFMTWNPTDSRDRATAFFVNPTYQNKVVGANQGSYNAYFRMQIEPRIGHARVRKTSTTTNQAVPGTVFEMRYRNVANTAWEATRTGTVGQDGTFTFENVPVGRSAYEMREVSVPGNYIVDTTWRSFGPVLANQTVEVAFTNARTRVQLSATKMGTGNAIVGQNERPLEGTEFRFYYEAVMNANNWTHIETAVTNASGVATTAVHDLLPATGPRRFRAVETNVPAPWVIGSPKYRIITLTQTGETQQVVNGNMTFTNEPAIGRIDVTKTGTAQADAIVNGGNLAGTEFRLYRENSANSNTWTHLGTQTTGTNGQTRFDNIALGTDPIRFRVCESNVPAPWYINSENPCQITTLSRQSPTGSVHAVTMSFDNRQSVGRIDVLKTGTAQAGAIVNGGNLAGTEFRLYRENSANSNTWTYLTTQTTGSNGQTRFDNIALGTDPIRFRVCESNVPAPWYIGGEPCQIVILSRQSSTQSVHAVTMSFSNRQAVGLIDVTKTGTAQAGAIVPGGNLAGTEFRLYRENSANSNTWTHLGTQITGSNGQTRFDNLALGRAPIRFRICESNVPAPWYINSENPCQITTLSRQSPTGSLHAVTMTFNNHQTVGQIGVTKQGTSIAGDIVSGGVIENTEFRLYREASHNSNDWIHLETKRTNAQGRLVFENIALGEGAIRFRVVESDVPAPWIISGRHDQIVTLSRVNHTTSITNNSLVFTNEQARGEITVIKNSETGIAVPGTIFRLTGNGVNRTGITGKNGHIVFDNLPLGRTAVEYTIVEEFVPAPYVLNSTPMVVEMSRANPTTAITRESVTQVNDMARGRLRIEKWGYFIVGFEDISFDHIEPNPMPEGDHVVDDSESDDYENEDHKVEAEEEAEGFLGRTWRFVTGLFSSDDENIEIVAKSNPPHLTGGLEVTERQGIQWIIDMLTVEGVHFNIYAREDIVLDNGEVVYEADAFIGTFVTDEDGFIESDDLYLGSYYIREIEAPNGFFIDELRIEFDLTYEDQYTAIVFSDVEVHNELQEVELRLVKVGEVFEHPLESSNEYMLLKGVKFGLFAGEDFEFADGSVLEAGTLIEDGFTNIEGELTFNTLLPIGLFYVQEMAVREFYVVDDTKHYFEFVGDRQDEHLIIFEINDGEPIKNELVRGSFEIIKVSHEQPLAIEEPGTESNSNTDISDDGDSVVTAVIDEDGDYEDEDTELDENDESEIEKDEDTEIDVDGLIPEVDTLPLLPNVEFELWLLNPLDEELEEATSIGKFMTDENGRIFVDNLIFGNYKLIETVAHYRHQLLSEPIYFSISYHHEQHQFTVANYQTQTQILKVDDLGDPLMGAHFQVLTYENEEVIHEWISTDEPEIIFGLAHGEYILRETEAPEGFTLMDDIRFTVTDAEETIYIVAENVLDSRVEIATRAHTGDGTTQYFTHGDVIEMFDNIDITHTHIREETPRSYRVYLFAVHPSGNPADENDRTLIWESDYRDYTVEDIIMTFKEGIDVDTSEFPFGTTFFFAETAYREVLDEDGNRTGWEEDYRHNWDGSDQRQMLFPREPVAPAPPTQVQPRLPQTGSANRIVLFIAFAALASITTLVVIKARKSKVNHNCIGNKEKFNK